MKAGFLRLPVKKASPEIERTLHNLVVAVPLAGVQSCEMKGGRDSRVRVTRRCTLEEKPSVWGSLAGTVAGCFPFCARASGPRMRWLQATGSSILLNAINLATRVNS